MNISYEFLYSGIPAGEENAVTGLLVTDTDTSKTYILQIPLTGVTPSEGKIGPYDLTEVESDTLEMVNASTLFQTKNVNPMLEGQAVQPDTGYIGLTQVNVAAVPVETKTVDASATQSVVVTPGSGYLGISQVTVNQIPLETKTVKSNTTEDQTITPTEGKVGISQITVQKFDGESGNPEAAYADGDEIYLRSIPAKFLNLIDKVAEFDGRYKAIVSDNNKTYASAQIIYADESFGPRIPMFDLIGKVPIEIDEPEEVVTALTAYWQTEGSSEQDPLQYFGVSSDELSQTFGEVFQAKIENEAQYDTYLHIVATLEDETEKEVTFDQCTTSPSKDTVLENIPGLTDGQEIPCELIYGGQAVSFTMFVAGGPK